METPCPHHGHVLLTEESSLGHDPGQLGLHEGGEAAQGSLVVGEVPHHSLQGSVEQRRHCHRW